MVALGAHLRRLGARMRNAAWLGGLLGGLDALNAAQASTRLDKTRIVVEGSSACALIGAIAGLGIGLISLFVARQKQGKFRKAFAVRPLTRARTASFVLSGTFAFAVYAATEKAAERIMLEQLHWVVLLLSVAISIAMAMLVAHWIEPALQRWFANRVRKPNAMTTSRAFRFAIGVVAPTLGVSVPLLANYNVNLGVLRRLLLVAVFIVLEHWLFLVVRARPVHGFRRSLGPLVLLGLIAVGPLLLRGGSAQTANLNKAMLLPDAIDVLRRLTNSDRATLDGPAHTISRAIDVQPKFSGHGKVSDQPFNVIWYIVDSLRADHLRLYGYPYETSPTLTSLASESFVFEQAYSQSSTTSLSIPSMLSGRNPISMHWKRGGYPVASPDEFYVSRAFKGAGYVTGLAINQWVKDNVPGLQYGFDDIRTSPPSVNWRSGDYLAMNLFQIVDAALKSHQQFFAVAHVDDVHHPYLSSVGKSVPEFQSVGELARYDRGIALFDQGLRILIEKLKYVGVWDRTVLIVTADHGEEFREHGGTIHSRTCYDEVTHVPLLVRVPNAGARRIKTRVALLDLAPTLLEMLDNRSAAAQLDGQSLLIPVYEPKVVDPNRPIFCTIYQVMSG